MDMTGTIKEIKKEDGLIVAKVISGTGAEITAVVSSPSGVESFPIVGDEVSYIKAGKTYLIIGSVRYDAEGETGAQSLTARNSTGAIIARVRLFPDGSIKAWNDNGFFELKTSGQVNINGNFTVDPTATP